MRFSLVGPTYSTRSVMGDGERTINFYPEQVESGLGKSNLVLYGTPGSLLRDYLGDYLPVRTMRSSTTGRLFAVSGTTLWELFEDNAAMAPVSLGTVDAGVGARMDDNGQQLFITSGGAGHVLDLGTNVLTGTGSPASPLQHAAFVDGYFIAFESGTAKVWISALNDALSWDAADFSSAEGAPGPIQAMVVDHRELWLWKENSIELWGNTGAVDYPFERINGAFIEYGIAAPDTAIKFDNCLFWVGKSKDGGAMVWRAQGWSPQRISNHSVEYWLQSSSRLSEATAFGYQEGGHSFYSIYIPELETSWVYDVATGMWHERAWWDRDTGLYIPQRSRCHVYTWGKHLIGDWQHGGIFDQSHTFYTNATEPIRRLRRSPHIYSDNEWLYFKELMVDMELGLGLDTGQGSDPQLMVRWSNSGGKTWSNERWLSVGKRGEVSNKRIHTHKLGRARDRVFDLVFAEPIPVCMISGFLDIGVDRRGR